MTLKLFSSAKNELDVLNDKSQTVERKMVADQHRYFLDTSGLRPFLEILNNRNSEVMPSYLPANFDRVHCLEIHNSLWRI
jgi:hypothetical protein